jgi:YaiO family outer membrane protein
VRAALLAALLAASAPAIAQAPDLYEQGVAARHSGDHARAIDLLGRAVAADPANADAHLQLGLALMAAGRLGEAERSLRRTLELAPDYDDARIALVRLEQRRGNRTGALAELERVNPANPEASELRSTLASAGEASPYRSQLNVDGSVSALDRGRPDWRELSVQLRHQASEATAVSALVEYSRRFRLDDTYGELRLDRRLSPGASLYLGLGATPNADFRPKWQLSAGGAVRLAPGPNATVFTLDGRQARYRSGDIQTLNPGIEQSLAGGRFWLTGRLINIFDETGDHHLGWLARGDVQASPRLRLFAGLSDAPDTSEGVVVDTFSLFGGLSLDLSERTTLRLSTAREEREGGSDRVQVGAGLGLRF